MKRRWMNLFITLVCVGMMLGCWKKEEGTSPDSLRPPAEATADHADVSAFTAPDPMKENPMVVRVNGKEITRSEVDQAMEVLFSQYKDRVPPAEMDEAKSVFRKRALENLINQSLLLHEADREEIQPDKEAVDARLNQISGRFQDPEAFQKVLASMGVSEEGFRQEVLQNLKVESLLANKMGSLKKVEKEELDAFYREHPENFRTEEQVRASHILVASGPDDPPDARAQKRIEMSRLQSEVKKGVDFAELARQHSDCPSKAQGGDLGFFERGKMVKAFEDAAFQMKTGEVSEIVETQFGYHLIKVTDHQQPGMLTLEQVRDDIAAFLEQQNRGQAVGDYLAKLRGSAKIEYAEGVQP